jgi:signal transduction histidine kinase
MDKTRREHREGVQESGDERDDFGNRIIKAQEEERRRIARELHDNLNQKMALLSIELEELSHKLPKRSNELRRLVHDLWARTQDISSEIHRMAYQLHPFKLEHLGLSPAVQSLCDELMKRHEMTIVFRHREVPRDLPAETTLCLFRIAQESLGNVIKHSGSREAQVVLEHVGQSIRLTISDAGRGFDPESPKTKHGLGLISMRERLRSVSGELSIHSRPFEGVQIIASIPLEKI